MKTPCSLLWLRRDLRLHDHAALAAALDASAPVQPVFIFDTTILARFTNPEDRRLTFLVEALRQLHQQLVERGGGLLLLQGDPEQLIPQLAGALNASQVYAARDHEPATRARDRAVFTTLQADNQALHAVDDSFLIYPGDKALLNQMGEPYKVFTPFARHWRSVLGPNAFAEKRVDDKGRYADFAAITRQAQQAGLPLLDAGQEADGLLAALGYRRADISRWPVDGGQKRLRHFIGTSLKGYGDSRNILADEEGTSRLSPYLRFGLVSVRECARLAVEREGLGGPWINELVWRDFYAMVLFHLPDFGEQEFYVKYRGLPWNRDKAMFERWCAGMTGYPVVDAAMRELLQTGWMHNRARMIVASFLTKHLQMDWRWGEEHFAQYLMDYERSSNVGGWQWAASTGIDPQPYFRIFNPVSQGQKFDANGDYVRRYVPELRELPAKTIHEPWKGGRPRGYPAPVVDHAEARQAALAMYKRVGEYE